MKKVFLVLWSIVGMALLTSCDLWKSIGGSSKPSCDTWNVPGLEKDETPEAIALNQYRQGASVYQENLFYKFSLPPVVNKNHIDFQLPESEKKLAIEENLSDEGSIYSGFFEFIPKKSGVYSTWQNRLSWIEIRELDNQGKIVKRLNPESYKSYCENTSAYNRLVRYKLKKGKKYSVGVLRSQSSTHSFVIQSP